VAHLLDAPAAVRLVSCADKLHNARAIVTDLRVMRDALFARFAGGMGGTRWYYQALAEVFAKGVPAVLAGELARTVETMRGWRAGRRVNVRARCRGANAGVSLAT
jgi:hypothetical protein